MCLGSLFQIFGVLIVLLSQVWFGYKAWRKYGCLEKAFFEFLSVTRVRDKDTIKNSKEELKKTFPEWFTLAEYLSNDLRITGIGLVVTLIGLILSMFNI